MKGALYKELWAMRFQEMLRLEQEGISNYESLLEACKGKSKDQTRLRAQLKDLVADEKKHVKLVQELLEIVERQPD